MTIAAQDLAIGYPGHAVARDIALAAAPGDVLCLLGPNGCGKTTLFKTLLGLLPARGGTVLLDGAPLSALSRQDIARRMAYVPQAHVSPFAFSAAEVVLMGRTAHLGPFAQPGGTDRAAAREALARVGMAGFAEADYTRLSGGQRQLVMIARALAQETPILVMDEPTASLDFGNQMRVLEEVARLAEDGFCIVLSTHDPDHAFAVGSKVVLMHDGRILTSGAPVDALTPEALSAVYGITVSVETLPDGRRICVPPLARHAMDDGG